MSKRGYSNRKGVDWYDESIGMPKHNQKHRLTKKYFNEFTGEWCSKKSKKRILDRSVLTLFDFRYYPLSEIEKDFGLLEYEKVAMFITRLYTMHYRGYKAEDWDFVYWSYDDLVIYLGVNWMDIIEQLNLRGRVKLMERPLRRDPSKVLRYFKLNNAFRRGQGSLYVEVGIKDSTYENRILGYMKRHSSDRLGIHKAIEMALDKTSLIIKDIEKVNEAIWRTKQVADDQALLNEYTSKLKIKKILKSREDLGKSKNEYKGILRRYYEYLCAIQKCKSIDERRALYAINTDTFGYRVSHMYSNAPRLYRKFLKIEDEEVIEVDIKSSQPSFLHALIERWFDLGRLNRFELNPPNGFLNSMQMLAGSKKLDLYKYMAVKLKGLNKIGDTATRAEMKNLFYAIVLGNPTHKIKGKNKKDIIDSIFGHGFYGFLVDLANIDLGLGVNRMDKNLVALLQREESSFLNIVMQKLIDQGILFLPLYDSLIVKVSDAQAVRTAFQSAIIEKGLFGIIRIN
jgi:hypothetical protein